MAREITRKRNEVQRRNSERRKGKTRGKEREMQRGQAKKETNMMVLATRHRGHYVQFGTIDIMDKVFVNLFY